MPDNNNEGGVLRQITVAVVVALLAGGTSPWWLDRILSNNNSPNSQLSETISNPPKANVNPLQVGEYESHNYYLDVFQKGERICIRATSNNGSTVASVYVVDSNDSSIYQVANYSDSMQLKQIDSTTISFGDLNYTKQRDRGFPQNISDVVQKCLDSTDLFFDHIPSRRTRSEVQSESPVSNSTASSSESLKVQNLSDGDYYFTSGEAPHYSGEFYVFRKQDTIIIGWGGTHNSDGSCLRKVILSDSQVETTTVTVDPSSGNGREAQIDRDTSIDDGSFGSSEFSQVDVNQYPNFAETIQACAEAFPN
jgi:hypothetical protein